MLSLILVAILLLRLPPYHCQYNPIKLVWAQVKHEVADKNTTFRLSDVGILMNTALENITKAVCSRVLSTQKIFKVKISGVNSYMISSWTW
jgi:transposase